MSSSPSALTLCTDAPAIKILDLSTAGMEGLMAFSQAQHPKFISAAPFPHIVIDNLFDAELLEAVLKDITVLDEVSRQLDAQNQEKHNLDPHAVGPTTRRFLLDLCSARFCLFLEVLTGIDGIIPDPHFEGGGIYTVSRGGVLPTPSDDGWHPRLKLPRQLTMMVYLNPNWHEDWGGQLALWSERSRGQRVNISPIFNKTVILASTTDRPSIGHYAHLGGLECPDTVALRSLSVHYYSHSPSLTAKPLPHSGDSRPSYPYLEPMYADALPTQPPRLARNAKSARRKLSAMLPKSLQKTFQKSVPKSLANLYRAGKRSLRG